MPSQGQSLACDITSDPEVNLMLSWSFLHCARRHVLRWSGLYTE